MKSTRIVDEDLLARIREKACVVCGRGPSDASHIRSRGSGGHDVPANVAPHCRWHHSEWHQYGPFRFMKKYPVMRLWLQNRGWDTDDMTHPEVFG